MALCKQVGKKKACVVLKLFSMDFGLNNVSVLYYDLAEKKMALGWWFSDLHQIVYQYR